MDFYEQTSDRLAELSATEKEIIGYILRNIDSVYRMSIRSLAQECSASTTTVFRLVKKLGYPGYSDFIDAIQDSQRKVVNTSIPDTLYNQYSGNYLKNITEAVRAIGSEKTAQFNDMLKDRPRIVILAEGPDMVAGRYAEQLLACVGFHVELPVQEYEFEAALRFTGPEDVLMVMSCQGNNRSIIKKLERMLAEANPRVISFSRADNGVILHLSDLNFYVFVDEIQYENFDISSRCGMIAIIELLVYSYITQKDK